MSTSSDSSPSDPGIRCPRCDTLNDSERISCIGCGRSLVESLGSAEITPLPSQPTERQPIRNPLLKISAVIITLIALWMAFTIFRSPQAFVSAPASVSQNSTPTATVAVTNTATPMSTPTPIVLRSPTPTAVPTETPTPLPTPTMQPPAEHIIQPGEALYNLALRYSVSIDSIISINEGLSPDSITSGQAILVPLPTATPPLEPVAVAVNGETIIADPTDCVQHEIQDGDSYFAIANRYNVSVEALLTMNRLNETNLLRPGDTICIPSIVYGVAAVNADGIVSLDRSVQNIVSPRLLYPAPDAVVSAESTANLTLQWVAERDLAPNEWYMVEITNLSDASSRPQRIFARQTSARVASAQLADSTFAQQYRWRVSYVTTTGEPTTSTFSYAFNGTSSESVFTLE